MKREAIFTSIQRAIRQGDTLSSKLFTLALEDGFKQLNWHDKGIPINGRSLNHLKYADEIVYTCRRERVQELKYMFRELE